MLDLLDSILAFSAIMLGTSLLVTVIVQGLAGLFNLRGAALAEGLAELFAHAKFDPDEAKNLASKILTHSLISESILPRMAALSTWLRASAIRKEELLRLLGQADAFGLRIPSDADRSKFEEAARVVNVWFDGQMDRVSQAFSHRARVITILISFITAFLLHLDAATLLERVWSEPETRAKLIASAEALEGRAEALGVGQGSDSTATSLGVANALNEVKAIHKELGESGIELLPRFAKQADPEHGLHSEWDYLPGSSDWAWRHLLGILASGALLSLGAPFWFNLLKSIANLRTVLAAKTDKDQKQKTEAAG